MAQQNLPRYVFAVLLSIVACILILILPLEILFARDPSIGGGIAGLIVGLVLFFIVYCIVSGQAFTSVKFGLGETAKFDVGFEAPSALALAAADPVQPRFLDEKEIEEKKRVSDRIMEESRLPGQNAPQFSAISPSALDDLQVRPSAQPMTPMYLLDNAYRIIDWNQAFTIAFDRTMEGRKGRSVLEWTYFLDNYEEVLKHGVKRFSDPNQLPTIDVEPIKYTSMRYGELTAVKRAYQIPDDSEACLAWLVTLDVKFKDSNQDNIFLRDLLRHLGLDLMWSEYAISYDRVLNNTLVYPDLLDKMMGGYDGVRAIPPEAHIVDLGAGTGNLALKLITTGRDRVVVAVENNRTMLQLLRSKCQKFLRNDTDGGGVVPIKQDITSLFGLGDEFFDFATLNNVLYSIDDADACLKEACRVLKPGGELRLIGPKKDSNLAILFGQIKADLEKVGKFKELETDYNNVYEINKFRLDPLLYRWTTKDVEKMLISAGFSKIVHSSEQHYAGQAMLVCAVK